MEFAEERDRRRTRVLAGHVGFILEEGRKKEEFIQDGPH
jgi:hypothetical protein